MHKKIHLLSESIINKISAGEVIENPASVVKELVDNAIDAKANKINVSIKGGGLFSIVVEDNGVGISKADMKFSILRHATSKIRNVEDLAALKTMGFRGEALSSICAVSKVQIISAEKDDLGHCLSVEGGHVKSFKEHIRSKGTTILLHQLFFNTPARKKFQKSIAANTASIIKILTQFSLSHSEIHFTLRAEEKLLLNLHAYRQEKKEQILLRIKELFGKEFAESVKWASYQEKDFLLYGYLGLPKCYKKNRLSQYLFINDRHVISPLISSSVKIAYGTRIGEHHHPIFILFLHLPPNTVDFNVHPQKKEVRLQNKEQVGAFIQSCVKKSFEKPIPTPRINLTIPREMIRQNDLAISYVKDELQEKLQFLQSQDLHYNFLKITGRYCLIDSQQFCMRLAIDYNNLILADLKEIYFLLIYINLSERENISFEMQSLIVPLVLELSKDQILYLERHIDFLKKSGFEVSVAGPTTIFVERIPSFFSSDDVKDMIEQVSSEQVFTHTSDRKCKKLAEGIATRKKYWNLSEAKIMLQNILYAKDPFYSPNGKPTLIQWKEKDIHKLFISKKAPICLY